MTNAWIWNTVDADVVSKAKAMNNAGSERSVQHGIASIKCMFDVFCVVDGFVSPVSSARRGGHPRQMTMTVKKTSPLSSSAPHSNHSSPSSSFR